MISIFKPYNNNPCRSSICSSMLSCITYVYVCVCVCVIACDMYTCAICIRFNIVCITTLQLQRNQGVDSWHCRRRCTPTTPTHPAHTCRQRSRVVVGIAGVGWGGRAEEEDRGAGGRWDETSHTSRKGNGVKVGGAVRYSYPKPCRRARDTHTGKHTHTHTHTLVCHTTARHTHNSLEHAMGSMRTIPCIKIS